MAEPFVGFELNSSGILDINFTNWVSTGSWYTNNRTFRFRFQKNNFALIGFEIYDAHRATGDSTVHSINFLTKKMKITYWNFANDLT